MAKAAELDKGLVDGLKAAKSKRAYFALVLKGSNDGALLISKTKVPPADIATAKKQSGGSAVVKGFCQYEEGRYLFDTAKAAPATAAQAVKAIVKRDAGMSVIAEFRISTDPELLADEGDAPAATAQAAPAPAAQPQPVDGAAVIKRFHAMTADIQASLGGPNNDRVKALFAVIRDQLVKKDFAAASKTIDELAPLVKPTPAAAAPKDDGAAVVKRFHAMTADIQASLGGPNNDRVKALFAVIRDQLQKKDFPGATKNIDELAPLVKPAPAAAAAPKIDGAAVIKRFHAMTADIQAALGGPNNDRVKALFAAIRDQLVKKDFAGATKNIDELATLVKPAPAAAAPKPEGLAAKLNKQLTAMSASIKAALSGPNQAAVKSLLATIHGQIKNKDFLLAIKGLRGLESLVGQSATTAASQPGAAPPAPPPSGADLVKRLNGMSAKIKAALAGPNKAQVRSQFVAVGDQINNKQFTEVGKSLDQLETLLSKLAADDSSGAAKKGADTTKRLKSLTPEIKTALAGPNAARVKTLFFAIHGQIKGKQFDQANVGLDELDRLVKAGAADEATGENDPLAAEWERLVAELDEPVRNAEKTRSGEAKWMIQYMTAQDLGADGKFPQAIAMLNRIDAQLKAPPPQDSPELAAAIQTWVAARDKVAQQLQAETANLAATEIDRNAEDAAEVFTMKGQAEHELRAVAKQLAGKMETQQQAAEMEKWLTEDEVVTDVSELGFDVKGPLVDVLGKIKQHLRV